MIKPATEVEVHAHLFPCLHCRFRPHCRPLLHHSSGCLPEGLVVSQITMPATTRLTPSEQAAIRARLIGRCFDEKQLNEVVVEVRDALQSLGYFRATVSEPSITASDANRLPRAASLNLEFREGARYRVGDIEIAGNKALSADQIISVVPVAPGSFLDMMKVREAADAIRRLYASNGYPNASIDPDVRFRGFKRFREPPAVSVAFKIIEDNQLD